MITRFLYLVAVMSSAVLCSSSGSVPLCCAGTAPAVATSPVSERSIYQLSAAWSDDGGRPARLADLAGQPVVLAMFFTRCEYACPIIVAQMQGIRAALPASVRARTRFVLVSFDPEHDSPETLAIYRKRFQLGDENWKLLHGTADAVRDLAMVLGVSYARDERGQYAHSNLITVLNSQGEIAFQRAGLQGDLTGAIAAVTATER